MTNVNNFQQIIEKKTIVNREISIAGPDLQKRMIWFYKRVIRGYKILKTDNSIKLKRVELQKKTLKHIKNIQGYTIKKEQYF